MYLADYMADFEYVLIQVYGNMRDRSDRLQLMPWIAHPAVDYVAPDGMLVHWFPCPGCTPGRNGQARLNQPA